MVKSPSSEATTDLRDGTAYNRDSSFVFFSRPITEYFTEVFSFRLKQYLQSQSSSAPEVSPRLASECGPTLLNYGAHILASVVLTSNA